MEGWSPGTAENTVGNARISKAAGKTVLLASHQDGEAVREAEQTGILRKGHLEILPESEPLGEHLSMEGSVGTPEAGE